MNKLIKALIFACAVTCLLGCTSVFARECRHSWEMGKDMVIIKRKPTCTSDGWGYTTKTCIYCGRQIRNVKVTIKKSSATNSGHSYYSSRYGVKRKGVGKNANKTYKSYIYVNGKWICSGIRECARCGKFFYTGSGSSNAKAVCLANSKYAFQHKLLRMKDFKTLKILQTYRYPILYTY